MLYLALTLSVLMSLWCFHHIKFRHKLIITSQKQLFVCEYCHCAYVDERSKDVTLCPQCQSFNKGNNYDPQKHPKNSELSENTNSSSV